MSLKMGMGIVALSFLLGSWRKDSCRRTLLPQSWRRFAEYGWVYPNEYGRGVSAFLIGTIR